MTFLFTQISTQMISHEIFSGTIYDTFYRFLPPYTYHHLIHFILCFFSVSPNKKAEKYVCQLLGTRGHNPQPLLYPQYLVTGTYQYSINTVQLTP